MFAHNERLHYAVRVSESNPGLANLMLEQFSGPQGELAAAMGCLTQAVSEDDPGRKDILIDIATEQLSHLDMPHGEPAKRRPWDQGEQWQFVSDREQQMAVDGGSGTIAAGAPTKKPAS